MAIKIVEKWLLKKGKPVKPSDLLAFHGVKTVWSGNPENPSNCTELQGLRILRNQKKHLHMQKVWNISVNIRAYMYTGCQTCMQIGNFDRVFLISMIFL